MRRQTLGNITNQQQQSRPSMSGPTKNPRMSLAPNARVEKKESRQSLAPGRPSTSRMSLAPSTSRQSLSARQSLAPSKGGARRSSIHNKTKIQDPRPIGDKAFQQKNMRTLLTYLATHNYPYPVAAKALQSPTQKDFMNILSFLLKKLGEWTLDPMTFEQDVPVIFKNLCYPFNISPSALRAPGTPHTWPSMLAALVWLIEFLTYEEVCEEKGPSQDEHLMSDDTFYRHTAAAYSAYLEGEDGASEALDHEMTKNFEKKDAAMREKIAEFDATKHALQAEIDAISSTKNNVARLQTERANYITNIGKLSDYVAELQKHLAHCNKKLEASKAEAAEKQAALQQARTEKEGLKALLDKQEISQIEVQAMHHQRSLLEESIANTEKQKESIQREIWDLEMNIAKKIDEVEQHAQAYNEVATQLEIVPASAKFAGGKDLELRVNTNASLFKDMYSVDLKSTVKPHLAALKKKVSDRIAEASKQYRDSTLKLTQLTDLKVEQEEKVQGLEARLKKIEATYRAERELMNKQLKESVSAVEDVELELHKLKNNNVLQLSDQEIESLTQRIAETQQKIADEREALNVEICEVMSEIANHKTQIEGTLQSLEALSLQAIDAVKNMPLMAESY